MTDFPKLPTAAFAKLDATADAAFYVMPRFVTHIDNTAIAAVTHLYRTLLPPGGTLLDLTSSWVSHLPEDRSYEAVIGHGSNAEELAANPRLNRWFVQHVDRNPDLPLDAEVFAVTICALVRYLHSSPSPRCAKSAACSGREASW